MKRSLVRCRCMMDWFRPRSRCSQIYLRSGSVIWGGDEGWVHGTHKSRVGGEIDASEMLGLGMTETGPGHRLRSNDTRDVNFRTETCNDERGPVLGSGPWRRILQSRHRKAFMKVGVYDV